MPTGAPPPRDDDPARRVARSPNPALDRVLADAAGRTGPTRYHPHFCADVVAVMGEGYSLTAFAGAVGASRAVVGAWIKAHPAFAAAVERGRAARTRALETQFLTAGTGAKVAAHVFALKNAAPEDWREHPGAEEARGPEVSLNMPSNARDAEPAPGRSEHARTEHARSEHARTEHTRDERDGGPADEP